MLWRMAVMAAGLGGGLTLAQLPEFSQQYVQRLGGAVDALAQVVADFDTSAAAAELTRDQALAQMTGTPFLERRQQDMTRTFERHARLEAQLRDLQGAAPTARALGLLRGADREVTAATYAAYRPGLPVTSDGFFFGGAGFFAAAGATSGLRRLIARLRVRTRPTGTA